MIDDCDVADNSIWDVDNCYWREGIEGNWDPLLGNMGGVKLLHIEFGVKVFDVSKFIYEIEWFWKSENFLNLWCVLKM